MTFLFRPTLGAIDPLSIPISRCEQLLERWEVHLRPRKVDVRLPGKGNSNSHDARPVYLIITMVKWTRASGLSIKISLSLHLRPRRLDFDFQVDMLGVRWKFANVGSGEPERGWVSAAFFFFFCITLKPRVCSPAAYRSKCHILQTVANATS